MSGSPGHAENLTSTPPAHHVLRVIHARPRLAGAITLALVVMALLPSGWTVATRLLVGWDTGVVLTWCWSAA